MAEIFSAAMAVFTLFAVQIIGKTGTTTAVVAHQIFTRSFFAGWIIVLGSCAAQGLQGLFIAISVWQLRQTEMVQWVIETIQAVTMTLKGLVAVPGLLALVVSAVATFIGARLLLKEKKPLKLNPTAKTSFFAALGYSFFAVDYAGIILSSVADLAQDHPEQLGVVFVVAIMLAAFLGKHAGWLVKLAIISVLAWFAKHYASFSIRKWIGRVLVAGGLSGLAYGTATASFLRHDIKPMVLAALLISVAVALLYWNRRRTAIPIQVAAAIKADPVE